MMMTMMTMNDDVDESSDNADDAVEAHGPSQVSSNNATLTRALSAESLLSQTTVASPKFSRGQFHSCSNFSCLN